MNCDGLLPCPWSSNYEGAIVHCPRWSEFKFLLTESQEEGLGSGTFISVTDRRMDRRTRRRSSIHHATCHAVKETNAISTCSVSVDAFCNQSINYLFAYKRVKNIDPCIKQRFKQDNKKRALTAIYQKKTWTYNIVTWNSVYKCRHKIVKYTKNFAFDFCT